MRTKEDPIVTRPWDTPGLPPRRISERCSRHKQHCAYRDDDPAICTLCHASPAKCTCGKTYE